MIVLLHVIGGLLLAAMAGLIWLALLESEREGTDEPENTV